MDNILVELMAGRWGAPTAHGLVGLMVGWLVALTDYMSAVKMDFAKVVGTAGAKVLTMAE